MSNYDSTILDPEWTFESAITNPKGVRVTVNVYVPERVAGPDVREMAEIAQMAATSVFGHVLHSDTQAVVR